MKERSLGSGAFPSLPHPRVPPHRVKENSAAARKDSGGLVLDTPRSHQSQRSSRRGGSGASSTPRIGQAGAVQGSAAPAPHCPTSLEHVPGPAAAISAALSNHREHQLFTATATRTAILAMGFRSFGISQLSQNGHQDSAVRTRWTGPISACAAHQAHEHSAK